MFRIDYQWGKPPRRRSFLRTLLTRGPVPLHMSNHYNPDHFKGGHA